MKRVPHFFKAKSRLGMLHPPMRHEEFNIGVEDGGEAILNEQFLKQFEDAEVSQFEFSKPEEVFPTDYYPKLAQELKEFQDLINKQLKIGQTQVVLGGDNSVTFSSLLALIDRTPEISEIGYIQFDSHGEMHLLETSISKNFHGMYMRPFLDQFDVLEIEQLVPKKLKYSQVLTIGDIIFDEGDTHPRGEPQLYKNLKNIRREELLQNKEKVLKEFNQFMHQFKHLHINFDIDILHQSVAGPSAMSDEGAWFWEEVEGFLSLIRQQPSISIDLVEINPQKSGSEKTIQVAQKILKLLLS